jgi:CDGSH-type Zn-finger protein/uncharacterized Fe-S cluster protein YjdI
MSKIHSYAGDGITVEYELKRCIHAAECVNRLRAVFDTSKRPWIQPQNADADSVAQVVVQCPSGALHYQRSDGGAVETIPEHTEIHINANGPLYVRGNLQLVRGEEVMQETRIALCRCGASKNKPFCDNSHKDIGFSADGLAATVRLSDTDTLQGGAVTITPTPNGSIKVEGQIAIYDANGALMYQGDETWLCRCGESSSKPFCDGTHKTNGFVAE